MNNQKGAVAILAAILLLVLLGFAALAIDVGYFFASKNELQNAADAGALAGARELYTADGSGINTGCNKVAYNAALQNLVAKDQIEIKGGLTNLVTDDIRRGHWSFEAGVNTNEREFNHSNNTDFDLWDNNNDIIPKDVLDDDPNFVNAVEVIVRRDTNPLTFFLAKILGQPDKKMMARAVAYIGFAGTFYPGELDTPVALCEEYLGTGPNYTCGVAVWYEHSETAMWTNLSQETKQADGNCTSANADTVKNLVGTGNTETLYAGTDIGVSNGMVSSAQSKLNDLWETDSIVDNNDEHRKVVTMTLPVIKCKDEFGDENTCAELVGAVTVEVLWMNQESSTKKAYEKAPYKYYEADGTKIFDSSDVEGLADITDKDEANIARWNAFAKDPDIDLLYPNEDPLPIENNQMYFRASCETAMLPTGGIGGENFGILSKIPVLVD